MADQLSLFTAPDPPSDSPPRATERMRVLVTVTAAPNPSAAYGETVCVAGVRVDAVADGWLRLYPVNLRHLGGERFRKYDLLDLLAVPQTKSDQRWESYTPRDLTVVGHLDGWQARMRYLAPLVRNDMCTMLATAKMVGVAPSLGLLRPHKVVALDIESHPGWTKDEQDKIDGYVNQLDLLGEDRRPLEAPRYRAWYRYRCGTAGCKGHRQGLLDWEFVAHQRRLAHLDDEHAHQALRERLLGSICRPDNDVMFYVGNQAKRHHVFSILGAVYPRR